MTLLFVATPLVFDSEGAPIGLTIVFLVAGALTVAAGLVRSGNRYLAAMIVAALFADFCAVAAFFAYLSAGLAA